LKQVACCARQRISIVSTSNPAINKMQRRTTLGQLHESHFNTPSAIPQPKGRFSVAPGRMSNYNSAVKAQGNMASLANDLNSLAITPNNKNARMSMNPRASLSRFVLLRKP
jgi:hypothetical protein